MKFAVIICVVAGTAALPPRPVYSSQYTAVYYQGSVLDNKQVPEQGPQSQDEPKRATETPQIKDGEKDAVKDKLSEASEVEGLKQEAVYYIYHPSGLLQRVVYLARDDPQNMAYTAQFRYENVEPIKEPIYVYDPSTFVLQQLQF